MKKVLKKNILQIILLCILFFCVGLFAGRETKSPLIIRNKVLRETGYTYINPILLCNIDNQRSDNEVTSLSKKLADYAKNNKENSISVYYLSLVGGGWAGVNVDTSYSPASMLKVPTVVDALKYAELNPEILSKKVFYDGSFDNNQSEYYKPTKEILPGNSYTVDDLLKYIIEYSDNNALTLLHENINATSLSELYKDLNITIPDSIDFMSVKTYSLFLRVLYNSTYINREFSEKILKLMTFRDFPKGLQSGLPSSVELASKFGERQVFDTNGDMLKKELHECGIVYVTDKPYILCIMTSGKDFDSLSTNIGDISKIVYDSVIKTKS